MVKKVSLVVVLVVVALMAGTSLAEELVAKLAPLTINGFIIDDPELIQLILRYDLEIASAPPLGIEPRKVNSVAELEELLREMSGVALQKDFSGLVEPLPVEPEWLMVGDLIDCGSDSGGGGGRGVGEPPRDQSGGQDQSGDQSAGQDQHEPVARRQTENPNLELASIIENKCVLMQFFPPARACVEVHIKFYPCHSIEHVFTRVYATGWTVFTQLVDTWTDVFINDTRTEVTIRAGGTIRHYLLVRDLVLIYSNDIVFSARFSLVEGCE